LSPFKDEEPGETGPGLFLFIGFLSKLCCMDKEKEMKKNGFTLLIAVALVLTAAAGGPCELRLH
jgi:hypothetical protein